jgi:uncharacterized membrane protein YcaP (DUF421 family)
LALMDWKSIFSLSVPFAELLVRGTAMYFFLYALFRVVIKRRVGAIGMADLLVLVIIADAAQNGMAGEYTSVTDAVILVSTIVGWNYFFDWLSFRFPAVERWLQPAPLLLVHRGRILWRNMRLELISESELRAKLREHGVERVEDVEKALIEPDGEVTVISRLESGASRRSGSASAPRSSRPTDPSSSRPDASAR